MCQQTCKLVFRAVKSE